MSEMLALEYIDEIPRGVKYVPNYFDSLMWDKIVTYSKCEPIKILKSQLSPYVVKSCPIQQYQNIIHIARHMIKNIVTCKTIPLKFVLNIFKIIDSKKLIAWSSFKKKVGINQ